MLKFFIKILIVLLPLIAITFVFECIARKIPTTYSTKLSNFNAKKDKIEVLVMGSSHSNFGINPEYFGRNGYNLSNTSQCLYQDYKILTKFLPECKNIKLVILPISYFTLQSDLSNSPEAWRLAYYAHYMGIQPAPAFPSFDLKNYSALFLWDGPLQVVKNFRKIKKLGINDFGYQTPETSRIDIHEIINERTGIKRAAYHDKFMDSSLFGFNCNVLEEIAGELKKKNIRFVFVTTPVYKTYYQHINKNSYEMMTRTIDRISNKYSASYYNYFYDNRFEMSDFSDNDHLSEKGAKKFSEILNNEIIDKLL